jgi:hypothetical protein
MWHYFYISGLSGTDEHFHLTVHRSLAPKPERQGLEFDEKEGQLVLRKPKSQFCECVPVLDPVLICTISCILTFIYPPQIAQFSRGMSSSARGMVPESRTTNTFEPSG